MTKSSSRSRSRSASRTRHSRRSPTALKIRKIYKGTKALSRSPSPNASKAKQTQRQRSRSPSPSIAKFRAQAYGHRARSPLSGSNPFKSRSRSPIHNTTDGSSKHHDKRWSTSPSTRSAVEKRHSPSPQAFANDRRHAAGHHSAWRKRDIQSDDLMYRRRLEREIIGLKGHMEVWAGSPEKMDDPDEFSADEKDENKKLRRSFVERAASSKNNDDFSKKDKKESKKNKKHKKHKKSAKKPKKARKQKKAKRQDGSSDSETENSEASSDGEAQMWVEKRSEFNSYFTKKCLNK